MWAGMIPEDLSLVFAPWKFSKASLSSLWAGAPGERVRVRVPEVCESMFAMMVLS